MGDPLSKAEIADLSAPLCTAAAAVILDGTNGLPQMADKATVALAVLADQVGVVVGLVRMAFPHAHPEILAATLNRMMSGAVTVALAEADRTAGDFEVVGHG